jgi:hypothetical protein
MGGIMIAIVTIGRDEPGILVGGREFKTEGTDYI